MISLVYDREEVYICYINCEARGFYEHIVVQLRITIQFTSCNCIVVLTGLLDKDETSVSLIPFIEKPVSKTNDFNFEFTERFLQKHKMTIFEGLKPWFHHDMYNRLLNEDVVSNRHPKVKQELDSRQDKAFGY
ncbi:hypothetical protein [Salirhabdus salicampi]|uniref:hypothetical protein n=1 Tax=Salirhabdus salicampi TaxID=476102 RepID=UPI0020C4F32B|nr:hypothetical protein [Salirhabdus salicampi]MCP8615831.1 hypothetical protein [Salirhabdus salicampi]